MAAGFEQQLPIRNAGRNDEIRVLPALMAIAQVVYAQPLAQVIDGDHLAAVGVAAEHQPRAGLSFRVKIRRLMVQHDGIAIGFRQLGHQFPHGSPGRIREIFGKVLPAHQIEILSQGHVFVLQHGNAVFLQFLNQVVAGIAPQGVVVIAFIVVAEAEVHAVGACSCFRAAQAASMSCREVESSTKSPAMTTRSGFWA